MKAPEPCCVPNCFRRVGEVPGFCNKCWREATDEERGGVLQARHAPFFSGRFSEWRDVGIEDVRVSGDGLKVVAQHGHVLVEAWSGEARAWSAPLVRLLQNFEARTTQAVVAQAIWLRREAKFFSPVDVEGAAA